VANVRGLNKDKWTALLRSAKPFAKKLIATIDPKLLPLSALCKRRSNRLPCASAFVAFYPYFLFD
jgi:hypothetical protein